MAASLIVKNFADGALTGDDAGGHSNTLLYSQGNLSVSGLRSDGRNVSHYESRGSRTSSRMTTRAYAQVTVSRQYPEAYAPAGMKELALGRTAGFVSTTAATGDIDTIDLTFTSHYDAETHTWVFEDCEAEAGFTEGDPSEESFTWNCLGKITLDGIEYVPTP